MPTSGAKSPAGRPERIQESRMRRRCWGVSGNRSGAGSATRRLPALPRPANFGTGPLPALGSSAISPTTSGSGSCGVTAAIWAAGNPAVTGSVPRLGSRSGVDSSDMIPSFGKGHPEGIPLLVSAFQAAIIIEGRTRVGRRHAWQIGRSAVAGDVDGAVTRTRDAVGVDVGVARKIYGIDLVPLWAVLRDKCRGIITDGPTIRGPRKIGGGRSSSNVGVARVVNRDAVGLRATA